MISSTQVCTALILALVCVFLAFRLGKEMYI